MSANALILGTLPGQAEAINWLKSKGWSVHACGHRRDGPGVDAADSFHLVDIRDVDAVTRLAAELRADIVYSVGSDLAMPTVARVSERLGLPMFHDVATTDLLQRKVKLRPFLNQNDLGAVSYATVTSVEQIEPYAAFPAVMKPSDSQGQRGIAVVRSRAEAVDALPAALAASPSRTAVLEEWLAGPEISVHVWVEDGHVRFFLPSDRETWDGPLLGIPSAHVLPTRWLGRGDRPEVESLVNRFVKALRVQRGPLYFQMKLTPIGPRIIEVASRLDGCHLWRLVRLHTGLDLFQACFGGLLGEPWTDVPAWDDSPGHTLELMLGAPDDPFDPEQHPPQSDRPVLFEYHYQPAGERPRSTNGVVERVGYRIVEVPE